MPFLEDIPITRCPVEEKDESVGPDECRRILADHINDCKKVLESLKGSRLTFSGEKSALGQSKILVVGHLCGPYGRKPSPANVEAISTMKEECKSVKKSEGSRNLCVLPHLDSALRTCRGTALRATKEGP